MLSPEVMATQSSWLSTVLSRRVMPFVLEMSKPSVLCAAGRPLERAFGALPAVWLRTIFSTTRPLEPEMLKQWVG